MPVPKKQKNSGSVTLHQFKSTECISFDSLLDPDYPIQLINENLLRVLCYEGVKGIAEIISLLIESAGCACEYQIDSKSSDIAKSCRDIEASCLISKQGCPSEFPCFKSSFNKSLSNCLTTVAAALYETQNDNVVSVVAKYLVEFSKSRLRSLRYTAVYFSKCFLMAQNIPKDGEIQKYTSELTDGLKCRLDDTFFQIRKLVIPVLIREDLSDVLVLLNDDNPQVRLFLLRELGTDPKVELGESHVASLCQTAIYDIDLNVRRTALRLLASKAKDYDFDINCLLSDNDVVTRNTAAEIVVFRCKEDAENSQDMFFELVEVIKNQSSGTNSRNIVTSAIARSLEKLRQSHPDQLIKLLLTDYSNSRNKKKRGKANSSKILNSKDNLNILLSILGDLCAIACTKSISSKPWAEVRDKSARLIEKFQYDDELLLKTLRVVSYFSESCTSESVILSTTRELFMERSTVSVLVAVRDIFSNIPVSIRRGYLEDIYQDLRVNIAILLGPAGLSSTTTKEQLDEVNVTIIRLLCIASFIDISDLLKLPIWSILKLDICSEVIAVRNYTLQVLRAISLMGDAETMKKVTGVLESLDYSGDTEVTDVILQTYTAAKMKNIDIGELQLKTSATPPNDEVWVTAVAARVI
ncbi:hypothetical protein DASB73_027830 [Starmerella bacillaris]|uniref:Condensin complex subunit 1 C-terminal domain-containing protein n=1 Tax=Starmerella bacillaris TaxID=1247836 RepID=A0AAV5RJV7_STABA|nr:hypothetical protein DASB73_027830 [Starmerella bacillaris]